MMTPAPKDTAWEPWSDLGEILKEYLPDPDTLPADKAAKLRNNCRSGAFSASHAIAAIGKLMVNGDTVQLEPSDVRNIGALMVSLGEVIGELVTIDGL